VFATFDNALKGNSSRQQTDNVIMPPDRKRYGYAGNLKYAESQEFNYIGLIMVSRWFLCVRW
jgi:hypothetical protein